MPFDYSQAERVKLENKGYRYLDSLPDEADGLRHRTADYVRQGKIKVIEKQVDGRITRYIKLTPEGRAWAKKTGRMKLLEAFRTDLRRKTERTRLDIEKDGWVASSDERFWRNVDRRDGIYEYEKFTRNTNLRTYVRFTKKGKRVARQAIIAKQRHEMHELVREQVSKLQTLLNELRAERVALDKNQQADRGWMFRSLTPNDHWRIPFDEYKSGDFRLQSIGNKQVAKFIMRYKAKSKGAR
jgi:hypothetical protein